MKDYAKARKRAFWLLSRWQYHSSVLRQKLKQKSFSSEAVEKVIEDCIRIGFLNNEEAILSQLRRSYGPRYIQYKFQITSDEVRSVITRDLQKTRIEQMVPKLGEKEKAICQNSCEDFIWEKVVRFTQIYRMKVHIGLSQVGC